MMYHNETCGCAECANYGQTFNPMAIHNQSCGCPACGNYPQATYGKGRRITGPSTSARVTEPYQPNAPLPNDQVNGNARPPKQKPTADSASKSVPREKRGKSISGGRNSLSKYEPLRKYLVELGQVSKKRMTFEEIEEILRAKLPKSALKYREWWANQLNTTSRPQAAAWLDAGFEVNEVHQSESTNDCWVQFRRK
jgi:hypothetical protein